MWSSRRLSPSDPESTVTAPAPVLPELHAPATWHRIDFISDLHLQAGDPATVDTWKHYLTSTPAQAIIILGDLFEVWVGDDAAAAPGFEQDCAGILAKAAERCEIHFMQGNRDFLLGPDFLEASRMRGLADPTVLAFAGSRWLLSHGDALCLDDVSYQQFRQVVRDPVWQSAMLARPLAERRAIARQIREHGNRASTGNPGDYADVDATAARGWLQAAGATTLIHGHTHRPGAHDLPEPEGARASTGPTLRRVVLSDWDMRAKPPRAEVLRLSSAGLERIAIG
ncbi:MAG: UDP-2,3-diacylglucosamine diphosphatase [Comamonadaceae bacterium]|jgi:UDP-2,3-diacylglucosamine hydrolase|nr:UDP-2,3-diacylglucosamine diphosphatase [Comamonadaceae bacterium]MBK9199058.1 UDP-2,3-diacylglucosamine diphosphatase [Betaproteobacteria bacterium]MBP8102520.1 UDP-2,3-diacylglucosamine diphosphatase [Burkholderiaceae bacterium]MBK6558553.1 UDP-2,3-diacylglucosamine diphosphatase [Comamonadaceae bacterium]MBK8361530.1 UDP-2,3-diacylglucosamine diphosphatase [Comamonadaceae bacterium]